MLKSFKFSLFTLAFLLFGFLSPSLAAGTFSDIDEANPHFTAIEYLANRGIFKGHPDGTFRDEVINRAELMELMIRLLDVHPDPQAYKGCFPDVEGWYEPAVCYAADQGWIQGYPDGEFRPAHSVNNAERFKIILNPLFKEQIEAQTTEEIEDSVEKMYWVKADDWFAPYLTFALNKNLEDEPLIFDITHGVSRGEVAEMIFRGLLIKENDLDIYHEYFRDIFLREQGLESLLVNNSNCYNLKDIHFDFYETYLTEQYGIEDIYNYPSIHYYFDSKSAPNPDDFPLFHPGFFCAQQDGGLLFSNMIVEWEESARFNLHLMRFDEQKVLVSDQALDCTGKTEGFPSPFRLSDFVKNPESFEFIDCIFAKDQTSAYFYSHLDGYQTIDVDTNSFTALKYPYSKDANHVYFSSNILEDANPEAFAIIDLGERPQGTFEYAKDDQYVFYGQKRLDGLDSELFTFFSAEEDPSHLYVKDDDYIFFEGEIINAADPSTFILLGQGYARDDENIYYLGQLMEGADGETFQLTLSNLGQEWDGTGSKAFYKVTAFDKNYFYIGDDIAPWFNPNEDKLINPFFIQKDDWIYFNRGDYLEPLSSESKVLSLQDMEEFMLIEDVPIYEGMWGKGDDEIYLMFVHLIEITDPNNFEFIDKVYSRDSKNVFHLEINPKPDKLWTFLDIPGADPATFQRMSAPGSAHHLAKDANHIYYKRDILETGDIDIKTAIFVEENGEIQDGNGYGCPLEALLKGDMSECAYG